MLPDRTRAKDESFKDMLNVIEGKRHCFFKEIKNMSRVFSVSSYRNTSGSLREREILWEHESSPKLSRVFL